MSTPSIRSNSCPAHALARAGQEFERIVGRQHRERLELRRNGPEHVRDGLHQAVRQRVVRDEEDADHEGILARKPIPGKWAPPRPQDAVMLRV
jgi:hypothetical protein